MKTKLIQWIVINQHPFTVAEENGFRELMQTVYPSIKIPSAVLLKRILWILI